MPRLRLIWIVIVLAVTTGPARAQVQLDRLEPITKDNVDRLQLVDRFDLPSDDIYMVDVIATNDDGTILAAGNGLGQLWYWNLETGEPAILNATVTCDCWIDVQFVAGSSSLLRFGTELWDLNSGVLINAGLPDAEWEVINRQGDRAIAVGAKGQSLFDADTGDVICDFFPNPNGYLYDADISQDGRYIALSVMLYPFTAARFYPRANASGVFDTDCNRVAFGNDQNGPLFSNRVAISPDGRYFAYDEVFGDVYLTTIPNRRDSGAPLPRTDSGMHTGWFAFSGDSQLLFVGSGYGLWTYDIEAQTSRAIYEFDPVVYTYYATYDDTVILAASHSAHGVLLFGVPARDG